MVRIFDLDTNQACGELSDAQYRILADELEGVSAVDDHYLHAETIEMLEHDGADPGLIHILRQALGNREDMGIRLEKRVALRQR